MDWKVFLVTFWAVFFAELADKTQLVSIGMAAKSDKPVTVWSGSVVAYGVVTILSVLLGTVTSRFLNPEMIRYIGGSLFIIMGLLMFLKIL